MTIRKGPRVVVRRSSFSHPKSCIGEFVASHPFNSALQICLPKYHRYEEFKKASEGRTADVDVDLTTSLGDLGEVVDQHRAQSARQLVEKRINDCSYSLKRCNVAVLLDTEFLERHVRGQYAQFCALSVNTPLDRTDAAAILPNGHLVLSVRRSTYERLGLVGQHATHDPDVYRIDIDLFGKKFSSDSRFSKKVMQCLREHTGELDFLCVKTVDGKCAEVDFSMMPGVSFHMHRRPTYRSSTRVGLMVPDMSKLMIPASGTASEVGTGTEVGTTLKQIHEWLGGIACGISDMSWCEAADAQAKRPLSADITCIEWEGLLPACSITDAITFCRDEVGRGACPWAAVYVWGFVDAPVSWLGTEHGCGPVMGGENDYIVLVLSDDQYVLFVSAGEGDGFAHLNMYTTSSS